MEVNKTPSSEPKQSSSDQNQTKEIQLQGASTKFLNKEEYDFWMNLKDWKWRIQNLYYIKNKKGQKVKFKPNWAQKQLLDNLWFFSILLKARQLGMTTFFCILYLDQVLFNANKTAGIIAHRKEDAEKFFDDKVKFAWDNLPESLKDALGYPNTDSAKELSFPNGSKIFVSTSTRGGTLQYLHISEFGKICAQYPGKAKEIVTGAINSVEQGCFVTIESTAEGRSGYFFNYCEEGQNAKREGRELTPLEFKFFFFPWWQEPEYRMRANFVITAEYKSYFESLEKNHGITLDDDQKRWYISKKKTNGEDMFREYPSTPEEAFMASIEGAYYKTQMQKVYEDRRIRNVPWDTRYPVDTWWDLGMNDLNVILFTQAVGNEIRFIDQYVNSGEGLGHYVNVLKSKPYTYGQHTFPHDINVRNLDAGGDTRRKTLSELGLTNIRTIERTKDINDDIEAVRKLFSRFYFDEERMSSTNDKIPGLIEACNSYRKEWDEKLGEFKNYPRHDKFSHIVDPLRLVARGWRWHALENSSSSAKEDIVNFF